MKDQNNLAHLMTKGDEHNLSLFAKRSVHIDGALIRQYSRDAQLCIITLPFLRLAYRWWRSA